MRHLRNYLWIVVLGGLAINGVQAQDNKEAAPPKILVAPPPNILGAPPLPHGPPLPPPFCGLGVVFVVNEVGENERLSLNLAEVMRCGEVPFAMETIHWTSYDGRRKDHQDPERRVRAASCLANKTLLFRKANPHARIIYLSQGDGCHIALMAAEMLPPRSVNRIILLAPAVWCGYDLRQALRATCDGIDNFFSLDDSRLERLPDRLRLADGKKEVPAAGSIGFCLASPKIPGAELYRCLLRQHKWDADCETFGVVGWHNSWIRERFLRQFILPLFSITEPIVIGPPQLMPPPLPPKK